MTYLRVFAVSLFLLFLGGCGGSSGGGGNTPPPPAPTTATGVFVDSPVAGLRYTSGGQSGTTNASGQFTYEVGQPVIFSIGDTSFPPVTGALVVHPLSIFGTTDINDTRVVNLARLLQTLDTDGNPNNGITLAPAAHTAATGVPAMDFASATFATSGTVLNLLTNGGGSNTLVSAAQAAAHLTSQLSLAGTTWLFDATTFSVITFLADGTYIMGEGGVADDGGGPGMEHGNYNWNPATGALTVTIINQTNGDWGLSAPPPGGFTIQISGDTLTLNDNIEPITATRVVATANPIVGSWRLNPYPDPTDALSLAVITLFSDGTYAVYEDGTITDPFGGPGVERGTYTWNATSGAFTRNVAFDTSGDWGLSSAVGPMSVVISGNTMTFTDSVEGITLTRVTP